MNDGDATLDATALSAIERQEQRLLAWGVTARGLTEDEAIDAVRSAGADDPALVLDRLTQRQVVARYRLPDGQAVLRSRMAETIRLASALRQWMGGGHLAENWRSANTLVADYKIFHRDKRRPKRDKPARALRDAVRAAGISLGTTEQRALDSLTACGFDYSAFQIDSAVRILQDMGSGESRGAVVCAGTGAGKTLAFYLPALVRIADWIDDAHWTRGLMLYPRNELLKDQFATAYSLCRALDGVCPRPVTIGTLYGETPARLFGDVDKYLYDLTDRKKWEPIDRGSGFRCPYLTCPGTRDAGCGGSLIWSLADITSSNERLRCATCQRVIGPDTLRITRNSIKDSPPDLLFTNMDQLNRRLCDFHYGGAIGVGAEHPPRVVLLDEAHTYEGFHGAQAALTLRRWRGSVQGKTPVSFVGLSATLADPEQHFAAMTGLNRTAVAKIEPAYGDLETLGAEYCLALRSDPTSGSSVLATTIQTAMLIRRVLDPDENGPSDGLFGSQVFCFADTHDIVNRLWHDLGNAEFRRLPRLRWADRNRQDYDPQKHAEADAAGQAWDMPRHLGHRFGFDGHYNQALVHRVSSKDRGMNADADIITATASLEVGYDSDSVGAVIQHKSPRSDASFVQRVGRAGRPELMRPWKIVVLSDYGRDRMTYQTAEHLFDPRIKPRELPVGNRYVLRIQATMAMLDWLAHYLRRKDAQMISLWQMCATRPGQGSFGRAQADNQQKVIKLLERLLKPDGQRDRRALTSWVTRALGLGYSAEAKETIEQLLWQTPRPVIRAVVPTLLRRFKTRWALESTSGQFYEGAIDHPLGEFVPRFLSSDLILPEVVLDVAESQGMRELDTDGVELTLKQFAPGNVTKRYSPQDGDFAHWVAPDRVAITDDWVYGPDMGGRRLDVSVPGQELEFSAEQFTLRRPHRLLIERVPSDVKPSSKCMPKWASAITSRGQVPELLPPVNSPWAAVIESVAFLTHESRNHAEITRAAIGFEGSTAYSGQNPTEFHDQRFEDHPDQPDGLGFEYDADAARFRCRAPEDLLGRVTLNGDETLRWMRVEAFRSRLTNDIGLPPEFNIFQRAHSAEVLTAALITWAQNEGLSLHGALEALRNRGEIVSVLERAVDAIFRSGLLPEEDAGDEGEQQQGNGHRQRRAQELLDILARPECTEALLSYAEALIEPVEGAEWRRFTEARYFSTLAASLHEALLRLEPSVFGDGLVVDILPAEPERPGVFDVWISESSPGGSGLIEALQSAYAADPGRFYALLSSVIGPGEAERTAEDFERFLETLASDDEFDAALDAVRSAQNLDQTEAAARQLFDLCGLHGICPSHRLKVMIAARLIQQPAADPDALRQLLRALKALREAIETTHSVEVDPHLVAYFATRNAACRDLLAQAVGNAAQDDDGWRYDRFAALLWPRGGELRATGFETPFRYARPPPPDRLIVAAAIDRRVHRVRYGSAEWRTLLGQHLSEYGAADLAFEGEHCDQAGPVVAALLAERFETGFTFTPASIERIERESGGVIFGFRLAGAIV
jgi:RAD3-like DEAD/DEAH box helicase/helicase-like protein